MPETNANAAEKLTATILADARREAEEMLGRARAQAEALLTAARIDAAKTRDERLAHAQAEAARCQQLLQTTIPVEIARLQRESLEALLESIRLEVQRRLQAREGFNYQNALIHLVCEAVNQIGGDSFVLRLSPDDRATLGKELVAGVTRKPACSALTLALNSDSGVTSGVIIQTADGTRMWDNRLPERLKRLWPELRRQIARHIELAPASPPVGGKT